MNSETELRSQLASALSSERRLREALEFLVDSTDSPPMKSCTCHISPPCHDCVDFSQIREALEASAAALTTPAACPDLVLVGRESGVGRQEIILAVNRSCSCGGKGMDDPGACPACEVWHRLFGDAVQKQVTEAGLKGGVE